MDADFSKPAASRTALNTTAQQARASVDMHLQGRLPQRQQTSASLHNRMAPKPNQPMKQGLKPNQPMKQGQDETGHPKMPGSLFSPGISAPESQMGQTTRGLGQAGETAAKIAGPTNRGGTGAPFQPSVTVPAHSHIGPCKNPQCSACGTVIIPSPKATYPIQERPSISINDWSIFTVKGPICSSEELDALNESRFDFPLPEMIFGKNCVRLLHEKTGACIEFNTLDALDSLASHADYKVSYYKEWLSTRPKAEEAESSSGLGEEKAVESGGNSRNRKAAEPPLETVKPYDWTYSTNYTGTVCNMQFRSHPGPIPLEKLLRQDPILFFDESILFEDELGDNGISMYSTKVRVMGTCLLLLCRFSMRIDDVAFRIRDTRVYIDFESGSLLREYKCQEASYEQLLRKATSCSSDPKKLLRDSNWVAQHTPETSRWVEQAELASCT